MPDSSIVLNPGVGGQIMDSESEVYGAQTRERERIAARGLLDPGNSTPSTVLPIYLGTAYNPALLSTLTGAAATEHVGAGGATDPADTYFGAITDVRNYAGFSISAVSTGLGQGYAQWFTETTPGSGIFTLMQTEQTAFAGGGAFHDPTRGATHYRIAFQNRDALATNTFVSSTILRHFAPGPFIFPGAAPVDPSFPATLVKAIIAGKGPSGTYIDAPVNLLGYPITVAQPFLEDVALGRVAGHSLVHVIGHNATVGTTFEDVWQNSGAHTYPTVAATASIVSTSALDTLAGTGARQVLITGLNSAGAVVTETVNLAGLVPVVTANAYLRIQTMKVVAVGTGGAAAGLITCSIAAAEQTRVAIGDNDSQDSFYTVPAGKTALLTAFTASCGAADDVRFRYQVRLTGANQPFSVINTFRLYQAIHTKQGGQSAVIPSLADTRWQAQAAGGSIIADIAYDLLIIDNALVA